MKTAMKALEEAAMVAIAALTWGGQRQEAIIALKTALGLRPCEVCGNVFRHGFDGSQGCPNCYKEAQE